MNKGRRT